ncbi:beta-N-acetyl-D-glucosaminide beta-1 4-N-acetylglucosaminyl-transferase, partial [Biomphalaria glabrata]
MSRLNIRKLFIVAVTSTLGSVILNLTISTMNSNVNIGLFQTKDVRENTVLYDQEQNNSEYINHENILDEFINHQINKSKKMGHSETDLVIAEDSTFLKGKTLTVLDSMRDVNGSDTAVTNTLQDSFSQDFTTKSRNDLADLPKDKSHITTISEPLQEQSNEQLEAFNVSLKHTDDPRDGETEQIYLQLQQREQLESEDTQLHQREQLESEDTQLHQREQLESEDTQLHQREKLESENTQLHQREQLESEDTQLHQREQLESEDTQLHQREQLESEDTQLHQRAQLESEDTQLHQREQLESEDTQLHQREELESENTQLHQREELESEDTQLHQREELESENTQLHQREQLESENTQLHQREELESEDTQLHQREELESENTQLHQREELESEDKQIQQREELESDNDQIEQNPQQVEQMVDEEIEGVADYLTSNNLSDTSLENVMKTAPGPVGVSLTTTPTLNYCPDKSSHLIGHLAGLLRETTREELIDYFPEMDNGGRLRPTDCAARQRLAVIFPYRNRYQHLHVVLHNLLPILKRQQVDVTFFVIEQSALSTFNRGALQNIGFLEAQKLSSFDCYIFHDVDLIPLNDNNLYRCESNPRHFAVALNKFNY